MSAPGHTQLAVTIAGLLEDAAEIAGQDTRLSVAVTARDARETRLTVTVLDERFSVTVFPETEDEADL